jgi:hypothetical protein
MLVALVGQLDGSATELWRLWAGHRTPFRDGVTTSPQVSAQPGDAH